MTQNSTRLKDSQGERVTATLYALLEKHVALGFPLISRSVFVSVTLSAQEVKMPRFWASLLLLSISGCVLGGTSVREARAAPIALDTELQQSSRENYQFLGFTQLRTALRAGRAPKFPPSTLYSPPPPAVLVCTVQTPESTCTATKGTDCSEKMLLGTERTCV